MTTTPEHDEILAALTKVSGLDDSPNEAEAAAKNLLSFIELLVEIDGHHTTHAFDSERPL